MSDNLVWGAGIIIVVFNGTIAVLFWLHERLERTKSVRLRQAVEQSVRAVEMTCASLDSPQKKEAAIARIEVFLGLYRWLIPPLVIETAIEAELFVIQSLHGRFDVGHDAADEVISDDGGD